MESKQRNFSILLFPWLSYGHVFPYLELAKSLSERNFDIYFCSTAINLSSVNDSLKKKKSPSNIQLVELSLPSFPDLPPHYHTSEKVPPHLFLRLYEAFIMSKSNFSEILNNLKPDLLIYDLVQSWAPELALSSCIPAVHFSTAGATFNAYNYHQLIKKGFDFPYPEIYLRAYEEKAWDAVGLSHLVDQKADPETGSVFPFVRLSSELLLMKSCRGIEGKCIDYYSKLIHKEVVPVGSLVNFEDDEENDGDSDKTIEWLNKKNKHSTVYISFGTVSYLSDDQMEEMAKGLELICDRVNFVWVIKFPAGVDRNLNEALPEGFLERVGDRGMIVEGWAPQAKILAHPSIGAFVSHCGMSSTFETIYFGVPVVAIPLQLDQPLNARLLTGVGVGVEVARDGNNNGRFTREDIATAIDAAVLGKSAEALRVKAAELRQKMKDEDAQAMNEAADHLRRLCAEYGKQRERLK